MKELTRTISFILGIFPALCCACVLSLLCGTAGAGEVETLISREHKDLSVNGQHLAVGRDGHVYVMSNSYVLRFNRDGTDKTGWKSSHSIWNVAANTNGIIGMACAHMDSSLRLFSPKLDDLGALRGEFLDSDAVGWMSPCDVATGPSGDFYLPDTHRKRIIRFTDGGKKVAVYSYKVITDDYTQQFVRVRVAEPLKQYYVAGRTGVIHAIGFDGKELWTINAGLDGQGQSWKDYNGDFDADDAGNVYVMKSNTDTIDIYDKDGKPSGKIKLEMGDLKGERLTVRLSGDEIFVKRAHKSEMFQVYARKTGKLVRVVQADVETVRLEYPGDFWTAGQAMPIAVSIQTPTKKVVPNWPVKMARFNDSQWQTLPVVNGKVTVPADASGLYHIRIGYGEYRVEAAVEVRQPGSRGTVNILTPLNRVYFGRGEPIPVTVIVRGGDGKVPASVVLSLRDQSTGTEVIKIAGGELKWNAAVATAGISAATTAKLRPGRYLLTTVVDGMTVDPQVLVIGPGLQERPVFNIVEGADGAHPLTCERGDVVGSSAFFYEVPSDIDAKIERSRRIGVNMFIDRIGDMVDIMAPPTGAEDVVARLKQDPTGVAPEKAMLENFNIHMISARGAFGMEEQSVLMHMDAMLPMLKDGETGAYAGMAYYNETWSKKMVKDISTRMADYPAFRGWTWAMNWWVEADLAYKRINDKYQNWFSLRRKILESGKWDPETVRFSDAVVNVIPQTDKSLNAALQEATPGKINSVTGPYRSATLYPPVTFATAAEMDLFCQAEQLQFPFTTLHNVDFYKRPGKRAFGHPETWNEDGSGGQIGAIVLGQAVRGADGTGWETDAVPYKHLRLGGASGATPGSSEDVRSTWQGQVSAYRSMSGILKNYGPWLTTLESGDRVALVVSQRMIRLDWWDTYLAGIYFQRLYEAYNALLYTHRPASFVFIEDLKGDTLRKYKALIVVGQLVELEPAWATALKDAQSAGVSVFCDDTCRKEWVKGFTPLKVGFDQVEKGLGIMNNDYAYYTLPRIFKEEALGINRALGSLVPAVADVENPEIMLTERKNGEGRFVWALNNDLPDLEPWQMWRMGSYITHRVPQVVPIKLDAKDMTVYEVMAMQKVDSQTVADLRSVPARLYAILPKPIESISLKAADKLTAGQALSWELAVSGPKMSYPVRLRLVDADGTVLQESFPIKTAGAMIVPINAGPSVTLEAIELISGKKAQQQVQVEGGSAAKRPQATASLATLPVDKTFGPHLRDVAVSPDGSTAIINAMNWTDNYYVIDTATGAVRNRGGVGHHYAYGPQASAAGVYVQGYDVTTPEGYHLYEMGFDGKLVRRIATYGLPQRQTLWWGNAPFVDQINNFVVSPKGQWIANAGNLGLIVWSKDGKKLWSQDWWKTDRKRVFILAQGEDKLITLEATNVTCYEAQTGRKLWQAKVADTGELQGGCTSQDGRTVAVWSDTWGGRVYVIRDGRVINTVNVMPDNIHLTPDGKHMAMNIRKDLRWYDVKGGIEWVFRGDDWVHNVKLSPDGKKIVLGSDLGTLYVLDDQGKLLIERQYVSSPVASWVGDQDLLVGTWQGEVIRLGADGTEKWRILLADQGKSRIATAPAADTLATIQPPWRSEAAQKTLPLTDNLLTTAKATVRITDDRFPTNVLPIALDGLTDGKLTAPKDPWLHWVHVMASENGWGGKIVITVESKTPMSVDAITFVEDPEHPESWLRNLVMQVWDNDKKVWLDCPPMLSDAAVHSHRFEKAIVGTKFRIYGDKYPAHVPGFERAGLGGIGWPVGNIRLAELVFHGKSLDASPAAKQ